MNIKSLVLGVAALAVASQAQAADLAAPAAEPVDYVRVCDAYGKGFFYIPGTETCLKIGGYVRVDTRMSLMEEGRDLTGNALGSVGWNTRTEGLVAGARGNVTFEAINNTDFGPLQSFISINTGTGALSSGLDVAWIKWAGFTFGQHASFFNSAYGGGAEVIFGSASGLDSEQIVWAYTAAFGNGISATLSIEAPTASRSATHAGGALGGSTSYGGTRWPDVVANVTVAQAWGSAQLSAVAHHNYSSIGGLLATDEIGYAVAGAVRVNIPGLGAASNFNLKAAYGRGAVAFVDRGSINIFADFAGPGRQTTSWGIASGLNLGFTSQVSAGIHGSYAVHDNGGIAAVDGRRLVAWTAMGDVTFTPTPGLSFRTGLEYRNEDWNAAANALDGSELIGFFRIQRSF